MEKKKIQEANQFGSFAENLAAREYIKKGYVILERNWRLGKSEIDIIAQKDNIIVLIEVKARSGRDVNPIESISHDKKRRMTRAADNYIHRLQGDYDYRFDFFGVTGNKEDYEIEILEDAFLAADFF